MILARLHPHQKTALAWMVKQENKEMHGMKGGILADVSPLTSVSKPELRIPISMDQIWIRIVIVSVLDPYSSESGSSQKSQSGS